MIAHNKIGCRVAGVLLLISTLTVGGYASGTDKEQELKRIYKELIDDENRHDLVAARKLFWDSPSTLFVAKAPVGWHGYWGIDDMIQHLHDMYQTPFRIDPNYDEEEVVFITGDIAETYARVRITAGYAGQNPVPMPFVMVLFWIRTSAGWKMTTDLPIPVPPDPTPN